MADSAPQLSVPDVVDWQIFPFEGDMRVRELLPRLEHERVRNGDPGGDPCYRCDGDGAADDPLWSNGRWAVRPLTFNGRISPFPAYMLETVGHLDIDDLTEEMGAELGVLTVRMNKAIMSLGTVGRVHFNRWGDGGAHFHVWFSGAPLAHGSSAATRCRCGDSPCRHFPTTNTPPTTPPSPHHSSPLLADRELVQWVRG